MIYITVANKTHYLLRLANSLYDHTDKQLICYNFGCQQDTAEELGVDFAYIDPGCRKKHDWIQWAAAYALEHSVKRYGATIFIPQDKVVRGAVDYLFDSQGASNCHICTDNLELLWNWELRNDKFWRSSKAHFGELPNPREIE